MPRAEATCHNLAQVELHDEYDLRGGADVSRQGGCWYAGNLHLGERKVRMTRGFVFW